MNYFEGRARTGMYQNRECVYIDSMTGPKVVLISGGGKSGDEKLIKGNSYGMAYITEANECTLTFVREAFDRTLASQDRKIFHDLNPKAEGHWYYTDVLKHHETQQALNLDYGYNYGHFTIADNMSVSDEQLRANIASYDKKSIWYQRDILGLRRQTEGLIYPGFDRYVVPTEPREFSEYQISCDYGISNPTAFGLYGKCGNVWYKIKEYHHSGREDRGDEKDDILYYDELVKFAGDLVIRRVIIDPSAASFIRLIRRKGKFSVRPAENSVIDGIRTTLSALNDGVLKIYDCCKHTINESGLYSWDETKQEDAPIKENDHHMDETRYFAYTNKLSLPQSKPLFADI